MIAALDSDDKWLRTGSAWGLGKLRDPRAVDPLLPLLRDKKKIVRKTAAWALGTIADERAIVSLTQTLTDEDADVRDAAQKSIDSIKMKKKERLPALL